MNPLHTRKATVFHRKSCGNVDVTVEIQVDVDLITRKLAWKAANSLGKKATLLGGAVTVTVVSKLPGEAEE